MRKGKRSSSDGGLSCSKVRFCERERTAKKRKKMQGKCKGR